MATETSKVIGTRMVDGYDTPVRIYWTRTIEGRDEDGDRVTLIYTVEDCPDYCPEDPEVCDPYSVACRTYRDEDDLDGEPWDFNSEAYADLAEALACGEEWAAAEAADQEERAEIIREGLAGSLEEVASEAWASSPEKAAIDVLAALLKAGKADLVMEALKAAGLVI